MEEFAGSWTKLARAEELIDALDRELTRFPVDKYLQYRVHVERGVELVVHVKRQPPWERWGVLVGEIVHDLRSSLDHVAWSLTVAHSGPAPDPPAGWWKRVEFPIFTDPDLFEKDGVKVDLRGVDPSKLADFRSVQPFHRARPEQHPLAVLHNLSIRDKHRSLPLAAIMGRGGTITGRWRDLQGRSRARTITAPLPETAVVARLSTLSGRTSAEGPKLGERLTIEFIAHVNVAFAFAPGPPSFGGELVPKLRGMHRAVTRCMRKLGDPQLFA